MGKYKTLIKNTIVFAIGGLGTKLVLFLLVPLYTNCLTTDEYGISELVFTISQFLIPIITLNVFDALIRFGLSIHENRSNVVGTSFITWSIGSIILLAFYPIFSLFPSISEWKWFLIVYVILSGLSHIELNYLKIVNKNWWYSSISIVQSLVLCLSSYYLIAVDHMGIRGYLLSNILSVFVSCIVCFFAGSIWKELHIAKIDKSLVSRMIIYSIPLILNNVSWWLIHSTDKIMIEWMIGASVLGIYTVSSKIPSLLNVVSGFFIQAWGLSSIKEIETSNDLSFYSTIFRLFTGLMFFLCVIVNSVIKPFILIYTGSSFNSAWKYVPALLVAATFNAVSAYFAAFYAALKKTINNMVTTMISAALNVLINYFFIIQFGVWGAVIGTITSYFVVAYLRLFDVRRYIKVKIDWVKHILSILITVTHMICVTLEFHNIIVSVLAALLLILLNYKDVVNGFRILPSIKKHAK